MSSTINASTASGGGVITSADASGILQLQTAGVTGITIDASQNVVFAKAPASTTAQSMVRLNTANGYGSTNTKIRRFTNIVTNQGSDITYADSATLGGSFTINTSGVYSVSYGDQFAVASNFGLSLNSTQLTTNITDISITDILSVVTTGAAGYGATSSATFYAAAASVVRAQASGAATGGSPNIGQFIITRVA